MVPGMRIGDMVAPDHPADTVDPLDVFISAIAGPASAAWINHVTSAEPIYVSPRPEVTLPAPRVNPPPLGGGYSLGQVTGPLARDMATHSGTLPEGPFSEWHMGVDLGNLPP